MEAAAEKTLYLIDGSGFIFRAYFGIRAPMTATDGTPTNAVFGYTRLLLNVLRDRKPENVAVVFDPPGPSFRKDIYEEYKANRPEPPEDLRPQFDLCRQATRALAVAAYEVPGFEADDVIGTLAYRWVARGESYTCVVVSADKDMMQLVGPQISMWDGKEKQTDRDGVIEKFGVPPEAVADALGLAGDSSDNIPGVPGIGLKTAATLLQQYGNLDSLLQQAHEVKGKRGENLRNFSEQARLSKRLATIATDIPYTLNYDELAKREPETAPLAEFFTALNFKRFLSEFGLEKDEAPQNILDRSAYITILTADSLSSAMTKIRDAGVMAVDLETTGLDTLTADIVGIALAWSPGEAAYIPLGHCYEGAPEQLTPEDVVAALRPLLEDPALPKVVQNLKYEWKMFRRTYGLTIQNCNCDTMLAAYLLDPGRRRFNLNDLAADYLGHSMIKFDEVVGSSKTRSTFADVPVDEATRYAAEDADITLRLSSLLTERMEDEGLERLNEEIELPLVQVISRMEDWGIRIDAAKLHAQSNSFAKRLAVLSEEIYADAGRTFNIDSPKQLATILFEELELPSGKKKKTGYSTDQQVLQSLAQLHPLPGRVLEYRHLAKLKNTYLDTLPKLIHPITGRVHTSFRQAVTATGRLSSSEPNLQNIPIRTSEGRQIREAFVPEDGWVLISADYSQIELRLLAHYSRDPGLVDSFRVGGDIHRRTAAEVFGIPEDEVSSDQRRQAKSVNFGLMYGMSAFRLSNELGIPRKTAREIIQRYFERYAGVKAYFDSAVEDARTTRRATTLLGRTRHLAHIDSKAFNLRQQAERLAINTPIQGSAADILKLAMIKLDARLRRESLKTRMLLTVHDELVLEAPAEESIEVVEIIRNEMEGALPLDVPLVVEVGLGQSWAEIH